MIPYAILTGTIIRKNDEIEIRILELDTDEMSFRLHPQIELDAADTIVLRFYQWKQNRYHTVKISDYTLYNIEHEQYWTTYHIKTENDAFHAASRQLMTEYNQYIQWKLYEDDAELSQKMTGYPAQRDTVISNTAMQQKANWLSERTYKNWDIHALSKMQAGIVLEKSEQYTMYLNNSLAAFENEYWECSGFAQHPLRQCKLKYLYIGSQFCHMRFPKLSTLFAILEKAYSQQLVPVVQFPYMQEDFIEQWEQTLDMLAEWCTKKNCIIELVLNDWGMFYLLKNKNYSVFQLTLGTLLNKRRKDTRMRYKNGFEQEKKQLCTNAVHADFYREYLQRTFDIQRISCECCGYHQELPNMPCTLYWPYYQMNTSQHCTLYAVCENGARGKQQLITACPNYCKEYAFLYPDHLHMIGYGNSLFGIDLDSVFDEKYIQESFVKSADRLIINFL